MKVLALFLLSLAALAAQQTSYVWCANCEAEKPRAAYVHCTNCGDDDEVSYKPWEVEASIGLQNTLCVNCKSSENSEQVALRYTDRDHSYVVVHTIEVNNLYDRPSPESK